MTEEKQKEYIIELWAVIDPQGLPNTYAIAESKMLCIQKFLLLHKGFGATWEEWKDHNYTTSKIYVTFSRPYDIDAIKAAEQKRLLEEIGLNCFGEYQMNNRRCIICQVGERCYDKRESLRTELSCDSQGGE